jgi:hypothetical protein
MERTGPDIEREGDEGIELSLRDWDVNRADNSRNRAAKITAEESLACLARDCSTNVSRADSSRVADADGWDVDWIEIDDTDFSFVVFDEVKATLTHGQGGCSD